MTDKKTALITGANKGLGYEIAAGLGARGYRVGVGARDKARGDAAVKLLQLPMAVEGTRSGRRSERLNHAEGEDHSS